MYKSMKRSISYGLTDEPTLSISVNKRFQQYLQLCFLRINDPILFSLFKSLTIKFAKKNFYQKIYHIYLTSFFKRGEWLGNRRVVYTYVHTLKNKSHKNLYNIWEEITPFPQIKRNPGGGQF